MNFSFFLRNAPLILMATNFLSTPQALASDIEDMGKLARARASYPIAETSKVLLESSDIEAKEIAIQVCLSIATEKKAYSSDRINAARILFESSDIEAKKAGVRGFLTIARDEKEYSDLRIEAAKILLKSSDIEAKEAAIRICLSIARDEKVALYWRIEAAKILLGSSDNEAKKAGIEGCLSIARDEKVALYWRIEAAKTLLESPYSEAKKAGIEGYLSIARDEKVDSSRRIAVAQALLESPYSEAKKAGIEGYLSIARDKKVASSRRIEVAKILFESSDIEAKKAAIRTCLSIARDEKVALYWRIEAAEALLKSPYSEANQAGIECCCSIAMDEKENPHMRIYASKALLRSSDIEVNQAGIEGYLSIARGEKVDSFDRINAARILFDSSDIEAKKAGVLGYLSIATDEKVYSFVRIKAARILFDSSDIEAKKAGVLGCLTIATDEKVGSSGLSDRINAAEALLKSPYSEANQAAIQVCLSIATDKKAYSSDRINAAWILFESSDIEANQAAIQVCLSIATDEKVDSSWRIEAASALLGSSDSKAKEVATQLCLSIAADEKVDLSNRQSFLSPVLSRGRLDGKDLQEAYQLAEVFLTTGNKVMALQWAEKLTKILQEDHDLCQKALLLLMTKSKEGNIYYIHSQLLSKLEGKVRHSPKVISVSGQDVAFNPEAFKGFMTLKTRPEVNHEDFISLVEGIFTEAKKNEKVEKYLNELLESQGLSKEGFLTSAGKATLKNLLNGSSNSKWIDPISHKFAEIVQHLKNMPNEVFEDELSLQSKETLQLMVNLLSCGTAIHSAIEQTWHHLIGKTVVISLSYQELCEMTSQDALRGLLDPMLRELIHDQLNGEGPLIRALTQTKEGEKVSEPEHQSQYLHKLIGGEIGLHFPHQIVNLDWNGNCISKTLLNLSRQEVLNQFYKEFTPKLALKNIRETLNGYLKEKDKYSLLMIPLTDVLQVKFIDDSLCFKTFSEGNNLLNPTVELTEFGAASLLHRLGYIKGGTWDLKSEKDSCDKGR